MGPCSRNQASWWHAFVLGPCSRNQAPLSTSVFDHLPLIQFLVSCIYQLDVCENSCPSHALWLTTFCSFQWGRQWRNIRRSTHGNWGYLCRTPEIMLQCVLVHPWTSRCISIGTFVHLHCRLALHTFRVASTTKKTLMKRKRRSSPTSQIQMVLRIGDNAELRHQSQPMMWEQWGIMLCGCMAV